MSSANKPQIRSVTDLSYEQTSSKLSFVTENGLRAQVYYNKNEHPSYKIYVTGDKRYGAIAFVFYTFLVTGDMPAVEKVGSPLYDLTRNADVP